MADKCIYRIWNKTYNWSVGEYIDRTLAVTRLVALRREFPGDEFVLAYEKR
jgi:hypothetical protein